MLAIAIIICHLSSYLLPLPGRFSFFFCQRVNIILTYISLIFQFSNFLFSSFRSLISFSVCTSQILQTFSPSFSSFLFFIIHHLLADIFPHDDIIIITIYLSYQTTYTTVFQLFFSSPSPFLLSSLSIFPNSFKI